MRQGSVVRCTGILLTCPSGTQPFRRRRVHAFMMWRPFDNKVS
jgi:hypothetical protein